MATSRSCAAQWRLNLLCAIRITVQACAALSSAAVAERTGTVIDCGTDYLPPFADKSDPRDCVDPVPRVYRPRHQGIGYDDLNLESEACFVPDSAFELLDKIVDGTLAKLTPAERSGKGIAIKTRSLAISRAMHATLAELGFGLHIPTANLGDSLMSQAAAGQPPAFAEDCDTASLVLMTIADVLHMKTSLVELTLSSGSQHNYVRWSLGGTNFVDWDTNAQQVCNTPTGQPSFQGVALAPKETMAYLHVLRGDLWERRRDFNKAIEDYRLAMRDRPTSPEAFNDFGWLVATRDWADRKSLYSQALDFVRHAIALQGASGAKDITASNLGNYYDTLACLQAYGGDYDNAAATEGRAYQLSHDPKFKDKQEIFAGNIRFDCTMGSPTGRS